MKIVIVGTGAVGGYYGGKLYTAGHDVFFISRGERLTALQNDGLSIKSFEGDFTIKPPCGESGEDFGIADFVIVCVKSYDTEDSLNLFSSNVSDETEILSLQNGVDNEEIIARRYGKERVIGGIAFIGARNVSPAMVEHTAFGGMKIGAFDNRNSKSVEAISKKFNEAGVKCLVSDDIVLDLWAKMIWNVGFNALCALTNASSKKVTAFDKTSELAKAAMLELIKVANAKGIALTEKMADKNIEITSSGGHVYPSMLQDMRSGHKMEIDIFNAKISAMGIEYSIETPVNDTLSALIEFINKGRK